MARFALLGMGAAVAHIAQAGQQHSKNAIINRFSAKRHVLGQKIYNDEGQIVGKIEDLILVKRAVSQVIVSVGGFLGLTAYAVAIPVGNFIRSDAKIILPRASKEAVRAMPRFEYTQIAE